MKDSPRILVTNDDGIHSPGLGVAEEIARTLSDDVWVVAPENEQSGASHSLTLAGPLRLRQIDQTHYAVSGTPTDCVMMACLHLLPDHKPDLVLSGVNWGSNMGDDITYSGTIAGAMEGCAFNIASIALSQAYDEETRAAIDWSAARMHGPALVRRLVENGWPDGVLLNVNFPACAGADVQGVAVVPQGSYDLMSTEIIQRRDARERAYYWIGLRHRESDPVPDSDLGAVAARKVSVTPLHLNLTEMAVLREMKKMLG